MLFVRFVRSLVRLRADLALENLALCQQVAVLKKDNPRPQLTPFDRAFWMLLRKIWPRWKESLHIVKAETVIGWHKKGFRLHWAFISRRSKKRGRPRTDKEIVELIRRMATENPTWGAPRIHGELLKLGLTVSERTVSRYLPKRKPSDDQLKKWRTFLNLHAKGIAAMDFFTAPTATFRVLYVWFVIDHERRKILHFNVTANPTSEWVIQQLREAFPYDEGPRHLIFDRDSIFSRRVVHTVKSFGTKPTRTAYKSPWQNPVAERWIKSCRTEMLVMWLSLAKDICESFFDPM
jgi:putative transposase